MDLRGVGANRRWESLPSGTGFDEGRERAFEVLDFVTRLVGDPERLEQVGRAAEEAWQRAGDVRHWDSVNADFGFLPAALFATQLDVAEPNHGWSNLATLYLNKLSGLRAPSSSVSLFMSPLALGFALGLRSEGAPTGGGAPKDRIEPFVSYVRDKLGDPPTRDGLTLADIDLIGGLTGACLYLHAASSTGIADARAVHREATAKLASRAWPSGPKATPPYWVRPEDLPTDDHRSMHPGGCTDLGVAHGISGVLLALSLLPETRSDAQALIGTLMATSVTGQGVPWWPNAVGETSDEQVRDRFAWCYGTPGVSRLLFVSADVLDDAPARAFALRAARGVATRVIAGDMLPDPGICHGNAGLLQVMLRFANDVGDEVFWHAGLKLVERIHGMYDPSHEAGFLVRGEGGMVSSPCLLNGALGIGLALMSAIEDVEPRWDRLLGLSITKGEVRDSPHAQR